MTVRTTIAALAAALFAAGPAGAAPPPPLTIPTLYIFSPYMDGQVGPSSSSGPEARPSAPDGWGGSGRSTLLITPIGDGTVVKVDVQINLITDNISAIPNPGKSYNYMMVAGLPPLDGTVGAGIPEFGFGGHFEGLQTDPTANSANFTVDGSQAMNDANGSRWFVVCSFWGKSPNATPYNAWWSVDKTGVFAHQCWLSDPNPISGKTPFRIRGGLWYFTSWAVVAPWIQSQEAAHLVFQKNPRP